MSAPRPQPPQAVRRAVTLLGLPALLWGLSGCESSPRSRRPEAGSAGPTAVPGASVGPDGPPPAHWIPPDLASRPDALPRLEPVRSGGPNKPYAVAGQSYTPLLGDPSYDELGGASWYGTAFHGRPTSSGEPYDMFGMTAAHKTLPIPSFVRVANPANGKEVVLRVNDRGPFVPGRIIDLSYGAAFKLGLLRGVAPVRVQRITHAQILRSQRLAQELLP